MMKSLTVILSTLVVFLSAATAVNAWHLSGCVVCDVNRSGGFDAPDLPLRGVQVNVENLAKTFTSSGTTDAAGKYLVPLPDTPDSFNATLDAATLPADATILIPLGGVAVFDTLHADVATQDWLIDSRACQNLACWLTGGGVKFEPVTNTFNAEHGPNHTFGGNVHPGCSPTAGQGGQWNHVAHRLKLHFQGTAIPTVRCGNVPGIPPGSTSPVTPFNFLEAEGTGTLKGIRGNKFAPIQVRFFLYAEDRNEPGSNGAKDGALIDRYFLRVFDESGTTLLLVDVDGDPTTVDPVTITGGNLQLHISSCDNPPLLP